MSLIRQIWLLCLVSVLLAFGGSFAVSLNSIHSYLQDQLTQKNNDMAQSLALTLGGLGGDRVAIELSMASQFDTGNYERIVLKMSDGSLVERVAPSRMEGVPQWFSRLAVVSAAPGLSQVSSGWAQLGQLTVVSQSGFAQAELWQSTKRSFVISLLVALLTGALAWVVVGRIRRPLDATVGQAEAIMQRRFITVEEPSVPELRRVTVAMNDMVDRVRTLFGDQAVQLEKLRQQAQCDPLTGLWNRVSFFADLRASLEREDGADSGYLMLVRLLDLAEINRRVGYHKTNEIISSIATTLQTGACDLQSVRIGRLNGTDFALSCSSLNSIQHFAEHLLVELRERFVEVDEDSAVVCGVASWHHAMPISVLMATVDEALAKAERKGVFALEHVQSLQEPVMGEGQWRDGLVLAIREQRMQLVEYPVINASGQLMHLECPLRLQVEEGGDFLPAARWLHFAQRAQLLSSIDLLAVRTTLQAIAADGVERAVNIAPVTFNDSNFVSTLIAVLQGFGRPVVKKLWFEVGEQVTQTHLSVLRQLVAQTRELGVHVGLEHAGETLLKVDGLLGIGLDYVKMDGSQVKDIAEDETRREQLASTVRWLRSGGVTVIAEGVTHAEDLRLIWQCGFDGITGPAVQVKA